MVKKKEHFCSYKNNLTKNTFYATMMNEKTKRGRAMPDLKLIKNPGYVYDLFFIFYCKFNADLLPERMEADEKDMEYFSKVLKLFDPISDDLYVFFRLAASKRCFFTVNYFHNYASLHTTEYDLAFLQKEISDYDGFIKNVIKHYFDELDASAVDECIKSKKYLFDVIKKSEYDERMKLKLYEFFIDPESYIRLLQYELMAKDIQLSSYYEKNYSSILEVYNNLNAESIEEKFSFLAHNMDDKMNKSNICLSFCLLNKNLIQINYQPHATLYLIGIDYSASIERLKKKRIDIIPEQFGAALSDSNRMKMLEMILEKGECTCRELEKALEIPASTAYHHVSTLERCGVVRARIVRKSMYYSIDRKYFAALMEYFKRFAGHTEVE